MTKGSMGSEGLLCVVWEFQRDPAKTRCTWIVGPSPPARPPQEGRKKRICPRFPVCRPLDMVATLAMASLTVLWNRRRLGGSPHWSSRPLRPSWTPTLPTRTLPGTRLPAPSLEPRDTRPLRAPDWTRTTLDPALVPRTPSGPSFELYPPRNPPRTCLYLELPPPQTLPLTLPGKAHPARPRP